MIDNFISNLQDGIYHVLSINASYLVLFLTVLILPYLFKDWKRILLLITLFTVGHCISATLVYYNFISVNSKVISLLIPLTVLVVAVFNIFTSGKKTNHTKVGLLIVISVIFGLIHGLNFSKLLNSIISNSDYKLLSILEIELGVVIGQLVIAFVVIFISFLCQTIFRFSKRDWVMVISAIILGCVLPLIVHSNLFS